MQSYSVHSKKSAFFRQRDDIVSANFYILKIKEGKIQMLLKGNKRRRITGDRVCRFSID